MHYIYDCSKPYLILLTIYTLVACNNYIVAEQRVTRQKTPWLCCLCEHKNIGQGKLAASIDEWRRISS